MTPRCRADARGFGRISTVLPFQYHSIERSTRRGVHVVYVMCSRRERVALAEDGPWAEPEELAEGGQHPVRRRRGRPRPRPRGECSSDGAGGGCGTATWPARSPLDPRGSGPERAAKKRSSSRRSVASVRPLSWRIMAAAWRRCVGDGGPTASPSSVVDGVLSVRSA